MMVTITELCREQTPALTRQSQLCKGKSGGVMMELQHNAISKKNPTEFNYQGNSQMIFEGEQYIEY